jgi:2-C-methyl-D-erythritol 4-phosphate cytidylyltransferase
MAAPMARCSPRPSRSCFPDSSFLILLMACAAIIVAAGNSRRMGFDKLAAPLCGKPVLQHSVEAFMACRSVSCVILVCPEERYQQLLGGVEFPKPILRVDGGWERQYSVSNGLELVPEDDLLVAVHDGARPLIDPEVIEQAIELARGCGAVSVARPVAETIKKADAEGYARQSVDRNDLWFMETPQVFRTSLLRRAYRYILENHLFVTDEVSAVEAVGVNTKLMASPTPNLKITIPADIELAQALLK